MSDADPRPLAGITVVDLTRILSGPFCSMFLADMGAEVIKVEAPGEGDPVRHQGEMKNGYSLYFATFNRKARTRFSVVAIWKWICQSGLFSKTKRK